MMFANRCCRISYLLIAALCLVVGLSAVMLLSTRTTDHVLRDSVPDSPATIDFYQQVSETPVPESEPEGPYPGRTIDQVFPILAERSFGETEDGGTNFEFEADEYRVIFPNFAPRFLRKGDRNLLRLPVKYAEKDYHSSSIGTSRLLGRESKQIYVIAAGPGAVCCTNYWIVDISEKQPRMIFRSEDYGHFRDPMEIFDHDGDGVYELVQYDSCFRYFMEECGACSPEPRVYFRFDRRTRKYRPALGIAEEFVRQNNLETEAKLDELISSWRSISTPETRLELDRIALSYFANLIHRGEKTKAWRVLRKYHSKPSKEMLREIDSRLDSCPFYQAISKK